MKNKLRNFCADTFIIALLIGALTVCFEIGAGFVLQHLRDGVPQPLAMLSDNDIRALYNTDNPDLYREVLSEGWGIGFDDAYSPFVEFVMQPYTGRHVNIHKDGYRLNQRDQSELADSAFPVFVFGGSTTLGIGVADHETIPAALERYLRHQLNSSIDVYNFGVSAFYSTQERIYFEKLLLEKHRPRVAVFIDGLNDFYFADIPDRTLWSDRISQSIGAGQSYGFLDIVKNKSNIIRLYEVIAGEEHFFSTQGRFLNSNEEVDKVIDRLTVNRHILTGIGSSFGITIIFVQQPVPTYHFNNKKRPITFPKAQLIFHRNSGVGYQRIAERRKLGTTPVAEILWLDEFEISENQYVDTVHYSPLFSRAIAEQIGEVIVRKIKMTNKSADR